MGPGAFRAEISDLEVLLESEGGRHDLAVNGPDGFVGEPALVHFDQFAQQGVLAVGGIDLQALFFLDEADLVHEVGALREQVEELRIDGVNLVADVVEGHGEALIAI